MIWPPLSAWTPGLVLPVVTTVVGVGGAPGSAKVVTLDWPPGSPSPPVAWMPGAKAPEVVTDTPVSVT